jgi:hypothetical protein
MSVSLTKVSQTVHFWNVFFCIFFISKFVFISYRMIIFGTTMNAL